MFTRKNSLIHFNNFVISPMTIQMPTDCSNKIAGTGSQTVWEVPPVNNSLPVSQPCKSLSSIIIQARLRKKPGEKVCDPGVVEIREGKMRVAADADIRQVNETGMTSLPVYRFHPESCHRQTDTPGILARIS